MFFVANGNPNICWLSSALGTATVTRTSPSVFVWVLLGSKLQHWLGSGLRLKWFNYSMALLLLATLYPAIAETPGS